MAASHSDTRPVLITGGNGNIGRLVAQRLHRAGTEVVIFDLPGTEPVDGASPHPCLGGDIRDTDLLRTIIRDHRVGAIIHLASMLSGSSEADPGTAWEVNASASVRLMQAAVDLDCGPVVFASTVATYGHGLADPLPEDAPQWPENVYGATKVAVERMGVWFKLRHGLDFRCLRFPMVLSPFAPRAALTAYPSHAFRAAAAGHDFTFPVAPGTGMSNLYIDDVISSLVQILRAKRATLTRPAYNLHGFCVTAGQIAATLKQRYPGFGCKFDPDPSIDGMVSNGPNIIECAAATHDWNWRPAFDFDACAAALFDYFSSTAAG